MPPKYQGSVKWFDGQKGYGFITSDSLDGELFVDSISIRKQQVNQMVKPFASDEVLVKCLYPGQHVLFDVIVTKGGRLRANNVEVTTEHKYEIILPQSQQTTPKSRLTISPVLTPTPETTPTKHSRPPLHSKQLTLEQLLNLAQLFEAANSLEGLARLQEPQPLALSSLLGL